MTINHFGQKNTVGILNPQVHTILKDVICLLVTSNDMVPVATTAVKLLLMKLTVTQFALFSRNDLKIHLVGHMDFLNGSYIHLW